MKTLTADEAISLAAQAATWPTIAQLAETTGIAGRRIRAAIADGDLPATRLNVLRVNPDDFAAWFAARQR